MLGVDRAGSGHRRYSERDLGWIELITKLRATGMPIRKVRRSDSRNSSATYPTRRRRRRISFSGRSISRGMLRRR
jgi:DNA-binding transcriptional MerR regulator